jgi:hypothetical protein
MSRVSLAASHSCRPKGSAVLDLLRLLLIHPGDFTSGVTKRMQDFI